MSITTIIRNLTRASQLFSDQYRGVEQVKQLWILKMAVKHGWHVFHAVWTGLQTITDWGALKTIQVKHEMVEENPFFTGPKDE
jgi:hypothetical protein